MEKTLIIFKPDALKRKICWKLLRRWEEKGFSIVAARVSVGHENDFKQHYAEHKDKDFFTDLVEWMRSGPCMFLVIEGNNIINWSRQQIGATDPSSANPGTIRADYAESKRHNLVHASDSKESAHREINIWFGDL